MSQLFEKLEDVGHRIFQVPERKVEKAELRRDKEREAGEADKRK